MIEYAIVSAEKNSIKASVQTIVDAVGTAAKDRWEPTGGVSAQTVVVGDKTLYVMHQAIKRTKLVVVRN